MKFNKNTYFYVKKISKILSSFSLIIFTFYVLYTMNRIEERLDYLNSEIEKGKLLLAQSRYPDQIVIINNEIDRLQKEKDRVFFSPFYNKKITRDYYLEKEMAYEKLGDRIYSTDDEVTLKEARKGLGYMSPPSTRPVERANERVREKKIRQGVWYCYDENSNIIEEPYFDVYFT